MTEEAVPKVPKKSGNSKQISPSVHWVFTFNNYKKEDILKIEAICSNSSKKYMFQEETGENGTPHLQGYIEFKTKVRPVSLFDFKMHWEKARRPKDALAYCCKEETRTGEIYTNCIIPKPLKDPIINYHDWQKEVMDTLAGEPDDRSILWIVDEEGNKGKTSLCKHICMKYPGNALYLSGKSSDMKFAVSQFIKENDLHIALFDFTRTVENYVSYQGIEEIKNGIFFSGKYEGGMCIFNSPHIICFSNFEPDQSSLSNDRWTVKRL